VNEEEYSEPVFQNILETIAQEQLTDKEVEEMGTAAEKLQWSINAAREAALEEGIEKGMEKGIVKGMEKGQQEAMLAIAKNLLQYGMETNRVSELTGLSLDEVKKLALAMKGGTK